MSEDFVLNAEVREEVGKGSSRRLRRTEGKLPAIVYGGKNKKPLNITLEEKELVKAIENEAFFAHIITLNIGDKSEQVIIKDLQRHPAKARLLHADFQRVSKNVAIHVNVPLHFVNEDVSKGIKAGGVATHSINEVEVSCLPADLPEFIEVDMTELDLDGILHLSQLVLPKGVSFLHPVEDEDHDHQVVAIHLPKRAAEADEEAAPVAADEVPASSQDKDEEE